MFKAISRGLQAFEGGPAQLQRIVDETGLIVKTAGDSAAFQRKFTQPIIADVGKRGIIALEDAYTREFAQMRVTPNGTRYYGMVEHILYQIVPSHHADPAFCEEQLAEVQAEWEERGRSPFMSAAFAKLAALTAHSWRGSGWAKDVTPEGWAKFHEYTELASDVMKGGDPGRGQCPLWHSVNLGNALTADVSNRERKNRYISAYELDVCNPDPHLSMAYQMLPRWHGSYQAFDAQARQAADLTSHERGLEMYTRCYQHIMDMEDLNHTLIDIPDMMSGFLDMLERWPTQSHANALARFAYDIDDMKVLKWVFESQLTEVQLDCWADEASVARAFRKSGAIVRKRAGRMH